MGGGAETQTDRHEARQKWHATDIWRRQQWNIYLGLHRLVGTFSRAQD